jgi:membrane protein DedA with SNARE-associated domain
LIGPGSPGVTVDDVSQFLLRHAGLVLFAGVFADQLGLPLAGLPLLLAAGALAAAGAVHPAGTLGLAVAAALAGMVGVGRRRFLLYDGLGALLWAGRLTADGPRQRLDAGEPPVLAVTRDR